MHKRNLLLWPLLYIVVMGMANLVVHRYFHVSYGEPGYIEAMLPFLLLLTVGTLVCLRLQGKNQKPFGEGRGRYAVFLIVFIPVLAMAGFFIVKEGSLDRAFLIPLMATFAVGVGEETMFRRILFADLLKKERLIKALLFSALYFSALHSVNVLAGMPFSKMLPQLVMTFFAGLYYALMYQDTKSIYLIIAEHWLWDYLLLSGACAKIPMFGVVMVVLTAAQIVITLIMLRLQRRKIRLNEWKCDEEIRDADM